MKTKKENLMLTKVLPSNVNDIITSVWNDERFGIPELDALLDDERFSVFDFIESQDKADNLTAACYPDGVFPLMGKNNNAKPLKAVIGSQTSAYHTETVKEHIYIVLGSMARLTDNKALWLAALLHDASKKYGSGTNKKGEVCFYGHAATSAYLAGNILKKLGTPLTIAKPIVHIVRNHMFHIQSRRDFTKEDIDASKAFIEKYGDFIVNGVNMLRECDKGITAETDRKEMQQLIQEGKIISEAFDIWVSYFKMKNLYYKLNFKRALTANMSPVAQGIRRQITTSA